MAAKFGPYSHWRQNLLLLWRNNRRGATGRVLLYLLLQLVKRHADVVFDFFEVDLVEFVVDIA